MDVFSFFFSEIPKNGGDEKNKNVERNPSNILPGNTTTTTLTTVIIIIITIIIVITVVIIIAIF